MISNNEFLIGEIPHYFPGSIKYLSWWREQKRRCIEGYWVSGKWMPGKLYFYVNFGIIKRNIDGQKVKSYAKPLLRDLEWQTFCHWEEARGFSGFLNDTEYTCLEIVKTLHEIGDTDPSLAIISNYPHAINPNTKKLKKYISPREYLSRIHYANLGRPLYENNSKNIFMLGARGYGKSYSVGSIVAHEFLFDGKTEYDPQAPITAAEIVVGAGDAKYSAETLDKAKIIIERLPGGQEVNGMYYPSPFFKRWRGTWQPGKQITAKYKKKVGNAWKEMGSGSNIKHRTFKDNPFAANGTRPGLMIFEEVGMFSNLKESYAASVECQREGATKFGSMFFIGTGGDMHGGSTLDAMEIFYSPESYDCIVFNDEWENRGKIGYFVPAYMALHDYMSPDGKIDTEGARKYLEAERERLRKSKGSSAALEGEIINRPLVPSEMFLQRAGSVFPVAELRERLNSLELNNSWDFLEKPVTLTFDPEATAYNGINYKVDTKKELSPVNTFPWKSPNKEGAVMIYEFPQLIDGRVPEGAYIIGHDPYAKDDSEGESLASIIVLKTKKYFDTIGHDEIVATYYGRPFQGRHVVNETLYKLSKFYGNAKIYFENVRGNTKEYFEKIKRLDLLCHSPQTILTKKASFTQGAPREYGYPMSNRQMKLETAQYVRDWLLEERGGNKRNLDFLYDKFLIQQLIAFNMEGNFDAVMGLFGCIIGLNETYNQYEKSLMSGASVNKMEQDISKLLVNNKYLFNGKYQR